ncbi:MAG: glycosyltransferase family 4 protein [Oxalobacteraceae bacterium]|nr:glycosyltransferase family 4 protein [Oxalobacteraceae bacterium]
MRILVAHNAYLYRGGEDTVVESEIALLQRHGHEVMLYRRDNTELDTLPRWQAAMDSVWSKRTVMEVGRLLESFQPHLIHAHNTFPLISPSLYGVAEEFGIPVVQTLHNSWRAVLHRCYRGSLAQSAVRAGMASGHRMLGTWRNRVRRYIVLNKMCREIFIRGGLPPEKLSIKPNFVEAAGAPDEHTRRGGLFIGRLAAEKGLLTLAQAIRQKPVTRIAVCGSGPLQATVEQSEGLDYIGFLQGEALRNRISNAEFLVMPSTGIESFGLAAIEAFACGTPVIASRHGGLREIVEHGHNGLLVTPGSADELADAIAYAVSNPMQMRSMGLEAYQTYLARYTPERNYTTLLDIYHQALTPLPTSLTAETIDA